MRRLARSHWELIDSERRVPWRVHGIASTQEKAASLGVSRDSVDSGRPRPLACPGMASTQEGRVPWRVRDSAGSGRPRPLACPGIASTQEGRVPWRVRDSVGSGRPRPLACPGIASTQECRVPWRVQGWRRLRNAASLGVSRVSVDSGSLRPPGAWWLGYTLRTHLRDNYVDASDLRREPAGPRSQTRRRANVFASLRFCCAGWLLTRGRELSGERPRTLI